MRYFDYGKFIKDMEYYEILEIRVRGKNIDDVYTIVYTKRKKEMVLCKLQIHKWGKFTGDENTKSIS